MKSLISSLIGLVLVIVASAEPLIEGRVRLDSGEPVAAAQVQLFDRTDLRQGAIAHAMTDGTGYFALPLAALTGRALPARFALGPNYPNPFNPSTIIPYQLAASSQVRLEVFNLLGQRIATLVDGARSAGFHTATWTATDAAGRAVGAGVYIYRMTVGAASQTGRMVLIDGQAGVSPAGAASVWSGASGGGSDGEQVYGLIVSGEGLVPYVDSAFRVEAGMAPVELVVSEGVYSAGKAADDDCDLCDLLGAFNDQQDEEEEEEEEETDSTSSEGGPDLIVQSPSVSAVTLTPGQTFTLQATVYNQGDEQAAATVLHYYRSNNATITASDTEVGTDAIDALDASATSAESIELVAPTGGAPEVYYGACVANVSSESNTDNNCSTAVRITVSGQETTEEAEEEDETPEEEEEATEEAEEDTPEDVPDDAQVNIPDAKLRAAIAKELGKARGQTITVADMKTLTSLEEDFYAGISDLTGLEFATNLTWLSLGGNDLSDVSPLRGLTNLAGLGLSFNNLSDISPLRGLTNLTSLGLDFNNLSDVSSLRGLTKLEELGLHSNNISDVSPLRGLTKLEELELGYNNISDVSSLRGLTKLEELGLHSNNISDVSSLRGLTKLEELELGYNNISDVSSLRGLTKLEELGLHSNNISDVSPLRGLTKLEELELGYNNISDVSPLRGLTKLEELELGYNNLSDVSSLRGLTNLAGLGLYSNNISDISPLRGLTNLTSLGLYSNNISDISPLRGLTKLEDLDLRGTPLNSSSINDHIPALTRSGATVLFDQFREGSDFDIELVFLDDAFSERHKRVIQYAARRWMSIIREDLPDYTFTDGWSDQCGDHSYRISSGERIDDLRIYVVSFNDDSDDAVGGWAGPDVLRETSHLSVVGCMGFNLDDNHISLGTALHEIGHVLGIGTAGFKEGGFLQDPNGDPHFNGPRAIAAFNAAGGRNYTGQKVPVEEEGRGRLAHWRSSVFRGELMDWAGGLMRPLSAITIQSLADIGYSVDVSQADPYTLPSAAAKVVAAGSTPDDRLPGRLAPQRTCGAGQHQEPIYVVDPQGRIVRTLHR